MGLKEYIRDKKEQIKTGTVYKAIKRKVDRQIYLLNLYRDRHIGNGE